MLFLVATLCVLLSLSVSQGAEVVYFGDGWALLEGGDRNVNEFEEMFHLRGCNVSMTNAGSELRLTASRMSTNPNSLLDNIQEDTKYLWLSIGMNDMLEYFYENVLEVDQSIDQLVSDAVQFLDPVYQARPDLRIVQLGYDLIDMCDDTIGGGGGNCEDTQAESTFAFCIETSCHNTQFMKLQQYVDRLQEIYPPPFYTVLNFYGVMQDASGAVPGPHPNVNYCTPKNYMHDCSHPRSVGYTALFDELWRQYFSFQYPECVGNATIVA